MHFLKPPTASVRTSTLLSDGSIEPPNALRNRTREGLVAHVGETLAHHGLVSGGHLPRVRLHLRMHQVRDLTLVEDEYVANLGIVFQVPT